MHDLPFRRAVLSCRPTVSDSLPLEVTGYATMASAELTLL